MDCRRPTSYAGSLARGGFGLTDLQLQVMGCWKAGRESQDQLYHFCEDLMKYRVAITWVAVLPTLLISSSAVFSADDWKVGEPIVSY